MLPANRESLKIYYFHACIHLSILPKLLLGTYHEEHTGLRTGDIEMKFEIPSPQEAHCQI